jgi:hypothetical protein
MVMVLVSIIETEKREDKTTMMMMMGKINAARIKKMPALIVCTYT